MISINRLSAWDEAKRLGSTGEQCGINWCWVFGFTEENANKFIKFLDENGYEHRGKYHDGEGVYDIRFR